MPGWELDLEVTQEDIDKGRRHNPRRCPIAHALRRAGLSEVRVGSTIWWPDERTMLNGGTHSAFGLSDSVVTFIRRFDLKQGLGPQTFTLPITQGGL